MSPGLHVHRWHTDYLLARDHGAPGRVRHDLDGLDAHLPDALARTLAARTGSGVVLIRRLDFDCAVDLAGGLQRVTRGCARGFAAALAATIDAGEGVLRFPSVAAWRACFIADLAAGRAWDAWYHRSFAGLRVLPVAAALRTVLLEDAALGVRTLQAIPSHAWPAVRAVLTAREAARILAGLASAPGGEDDLAPLVALAARATEWTSPGSSAPVNALAVFAAGLRSGLPATAALGQWAMLVGELVTPAGQHDCRGARSAVPGAARRALAARPHWRRALADIFPPGDADPAGRDPQTLRGTASEFAALALLLPELDALLDARIAQALPPAAPGGARNLVAWLALAHCAGRSRGRRFLSEVFWRELFAIAPAFGPGQAGEWMRGAPADAALAQLALRNGTPPGEVGPAAAPPIDAHRARADWRHLALGLALPRPWRHFLMLLARAAMRRFASRLPGFAGASLPCLYANFLAGPGYRDASMRLRLARPPLHVLVRMSGLARSRLVWSGPPARVLVAEYLS